MERYSRIAVKIGLVLFGIFAVISTQNGGTVVHPMTAIWMLMSAAITGIREIRQGYRPIYFAIPEMALCVAGILWIVIALALAYYDIQFVPASGTLLAFAIFWAVHIMLQIDRLPHIRALYFITAGFGLIGLLGHVFDTPILRYQFDETRQGMALATSIFLIVLGLAAYSRERQGP